MPDGNHHGFVSELTTIQKDILEVLEVPFGCFSYDYLFNTSQALKHEADFGTETNPQ
jgi:hypothetical protein